VRPMVRPGLKILRRDPRTLQLGFDWPGVAALRDTDAVRAVLAAIDGVRDAAEVISVATRAGVPVSGCDQALGDLVECGAVVYSAGPTPPELSEATASALWLLAGPKRVLSDVVAARHRCTVWVHGSGVVADTVRRLTSAAGIRVCSDPDRATVGVLAGDREPERELADDALHAGVPHLWVFMRDLVGVIGPFVLPGTTACLRCVDTARAETDPAWPTLLQSSWAKPLRVAACDELHAILTGAWAAQEIAVWASGITPRTCGCVVELPLGGGPVEAVAFEPHPACGCGWLEWRDTMGA
jgi:hypothetical protein